jgi:thiosulfate/3-mercaptopyruvate sulfurtransferase
MTYARHLVAVLALVALATACGATSASAGGVRSSMLVSPAELSRKLGDPSLVLLHVGTREEYDAGHIPGARFVEREALSTPRGSGLVLELPPIAQLQTAFEQLGIADTSRVVVYYGSDWVTPTARLFFTLDYVGLGDRTAMLDGGMPAWKAAGHETTTAAPPPAKAGKLTLKAHPELVVDAAWVSKNGRDARVALFDARDAKFYDGTEKGNNNPRAGHIPGAKSVPFASLVDEQTNAMKPPDALRQIFVAAGADAKDTVVSYCHIGQQASLVYFTARYLGYDAKLYDGSFEEWSAREDLPVETK